jgi:hypothetical protein
MMTFSSSRLHKYSFGIQCIRKLGDLTTEREDWVGRGGKEKEEDEYDEDAESHLKKYRKAFGDGGAMSAERSKVAKKILPKSPKRFIGHPIDVGLLPVMYDLQGHIFIIR